MRVEFDIDTPAAAMRSSVAGIATQRRARRCCWPASTGGMPTEAEARNLGSWAREFGPGARFWPMPAAAGIRFA